MGAPGSTAAGGLAGLAGPIGMGMQLAGAGFQIARAIDQKKKARDAERASAELLEQAKRRLDVNRQEGVQVPLDAYEQAMREMTAQQGQSLMGLREADERSLAAGVGKLAAAGTAGVEGLRGKMEEAIYARDKAIADEAARIDSMMAGISLTEAEGAQEAAKQREEASAMALQGAISGIGGAFDTMAKSQDLYSQRQGELAAAQAYQQQTGKYQDMNASQARRAMLDAGITQQGFQNLAAGLTVGGRVVQTPITMPMTGITPLSTTGIVGLGGIKPIY